MSRWESHPQVSFRDTANIAPSDAKDTRDAIINPEKLKSSEAVDEIIKIRIVFNNKDAQEISEETIDKIQLIKDHDNSQIILEIKKQKEKGEEEKSSPNKGLLETLEKSGLTFKKEPDSQNLSLKIEFSDFEKSTFRIFGVLHALKFGPDKTTVISAYTSATKIATTQLMGYQMVAVDSIKQTKQLLEEELRKIKQRIKDLEEILNEQTEKELSTITAESKAELEGIKRQLAAFKVDEKQQGQLLTLRFMSINLNALIALNDHKVTAIRTHAPEFEKGLNAVMRSKTVTLEATKSDKDVATNSSTSSKMLYRVFNEARGKDAGPASGTATFGTKGDAAVKSGPTNIQSIPEASF